MSFKQANGERARDAGDTPDLIVQLVTASVTLTSQAAALQFFSASSSFINKIDLAGYRQARLTARVVTVSASVNSPRLRLIYSPTFDITVANWLQIGAGGQIEASMFTGATVADSGWIPLAPGAQINDCFVSLAMIGGDGSASPAVNSVSVAFR